MNKVITTTVLIATQKEKVFWSMFATGVVLFVAYVFLVQSSVFYTLSTRKWDSEIVKTSASIASLENSYYSLSNQIGLDSAYNIGFVDLHSISYVKVEGLKGEVSYLKTE